MLKFIKRLFTAKTHVELTTIKGENFLLHKGCIVSVALVDKPEYLKEVKTSKIVLVITDQLKTVVDKDGKTVEENQKIWVLQNYKSLKKLLS